MPSARQMRRARRARALGALQPDGAGFRKPFQHAGAAQQFQVIEALVAGNFAAARGRGWLA